MKIKSVYLAGAMGCFKDNLEAMNGWRIKVTNYLNDYVDRIGRRLDIVNPVDYFNFIEPRKYKTQKEIMDFDLFHVKRSDLIIVNLDHINESAGTIIELYQANKISDIPVIAFGDNSNIHPWILECINRIEPDLQSAIEYINEFYLIA